MLTVFYLKLLFKFTCNHVLDVAKLFAVHLSYDICIVLLFVLYRLLLTVKTCNTRQNILPRGIRYMLI